MRGQIPGGGWSGQRRRTKSLHRINGEGSGCPNPLRTRTEMKQMRAGVGRKQRGTRRRGAGVIRHSESRRPLDFPSPARSGERRALQRRGRGGEKLQRRGGSGESGGINAGGRARAVVLSDFGSGCGAVPRDGWVDQARAALGWWVGLGSGPSVGPRCISYIECTHTKMHPGAF